MGFLGDLFGSIFGGGNDAPPPPDYTPLATSSVEVANIGAQLGREQMAQAGSLASQQMDQTNRMFDRYMAENTRQYDQNMAVAKPVTDAQLDILKQAKTQGDELYDYSKTFRPLEQRMASIIQDPAGPLADAEERSAIGARVARNAQVLGDRADAFEGETLRDIDTYTSGNRAIEALYKPDIDYQVGQAMADAREGQTAAQNMAMRQAMRYGINVPAAASGLSTQQASQLASAANNTRNTAIDSYRNLIGQGIGLKSDAFKTGTAAQMDAMAKGEGALASNRDMRMQDQNLLWGRYMDVTGMARGMSGASQGAYNVATNAGNSAVSNRTGVGNSYLANMAQGNGQMLQGMGMSGNTAMSGLNAGTNTIMQGRQLAMNGLGNILNSQTNSYNTGMQSGDSLGSILGGAGGVLMGAAKAGWISDRRLKENIEAVGRDEATGLNLYEFNYINDTSGKRYRGVMADEVERFDPEAVAYVDGFAAVKYDRLGLQMVEV